MTTILEFKNYRMGFKDDEGKQYNLLDDYDIEKVLSGNIIRVLSEVWPQSIVS